MTQPAMPPGTTGVTKTTRATAGGGLGDKLEADLEMRSPLDDSTMSGMGLDVEKDLIRDLRFEGTGCAISTASASLMSEAVKGKSSAEAAALFDAVHRMLTGGGDTTGAGLGKLAALAGVREFPARVMCASLCWHTLNAALAGAAQPVSTE